MILAYLLGVGDGPAAACVCVPPGHVGAPLPCSMVKLVDVPEMQYYAQDGVGEVGWSRRPSSWEGCSPADRLCAQICMRGPSVFRGYLRDPDRTAEALDSEGWLHSGDVGQWLPVSRTAAFVSGQT